jgi:copper chaperone NosL
VLVPVSRRGALKRALAALLALSLGRAAPAALAPRPVAIGEDRCPACNMAVFDARFAAQGHTVGGRVSVYDAIECLADHLGGHAGEVPLLVGAYVADRVASERAEAIWLPADDALFLYHPALRTPMGGGLAAFENTEAALAFAAAGRLADPQLLGWERLLERGIERPWVPLV